MRTLLTTALLTLAACGGPPETVGYVVDVWDNPIPEADVILPSLNLRMTTDEGGRFTFPTVEGPIDVKVGRAGYIHDELKLALDPEAPRPTVQLYKKPEANGFYAIDQAGYTKLEPQTIQQFGSRIEQLQGVRTLGDVSMQGDQLSVILHTDLKLDQVMRLGLKLHKLEYTEEALVSGSIEGEPVAVNLWTSAKTIDLEITALRSKKDYLAESPEGLEPGAYAIDTQSLLVPSSPGFLRVPKALRVAYPLELR